MENLRERLPEMAIISVGHRPELAAFHERKVNLVRRQGGAILVPGEIAAPPVNVLSNLVRRWRTPPSASPATPTANEAPAPRAAREPARDKGEKQTQKKREKESAR